MASDEAEKTLPYSLGDQTVKNVREIHLDYVVINYTYSIKKQSEIKDLLDRLPKNLADLKEASRVMAERALSIQVRGSRGDKVELFMDGYRLYFQDKIYESPKGLYEHITEKLYELYDRDRAVKKEITIEMTKSLKSS